MPWKLEHNNKSLVKYIFPNQIYVVGRLLADIIINDKSVSRKHATITWNLNSDFIQVEDFSKFGTTINKRSLKDKKGFIYDEDIITFGAQPGVDFKCCYVSFNVATSTLINSDKEILEQYVSSCGGSILDSWDKDVEYLVMSSLRVTYKVVCALIKQMQIVNINFVRDMIDYFKGTTSDIPDKDQYLPEIQETNFSITPSFLKPNPARATLFQGKKFYFLTNGKLLKLEEAVKSAGGQTILLTESNNRDSIQKLGLADPDNIVMFETGSSSLINLVYAVLKSSRRRPIIDSEIGYAVLNASTEEFCNPTKSINSNIFPDIDLSDIFTICPLGGVVQDKTVLKKRLLDDIENCENIKRSKAVHKKIKSIDEANNGILQISSNNRNILMENNDLDEKCKKIDNRLSNNDKNKSILPITKEVKKQSLNIETKKTDKLFPIVQNNQYLQKFNEDDSHDEFDDISVPNFGSSSTKEKPVTKISVHNKCHKKDVPNNITEPTAPESDTSNNVKQFKQFVESGIELIPTKTRAVITEEHRVVGTPVDCLVKFVSLVKENYSLRGNTKTFRKVSEVVINHQSIKLTPYRQ